MEIKNRKLTRRKKMKRKIIGIFVMTLLIATIVSQVSACTGFTYNDENKVFACHNEDWHNFFTLRFFPATEDKYGAMFIEVYDDTIDMISPFSGMNDQGAWYSMYIHPHLEQVNLTDLPDYYDPNSYYKFHSGEPCLFECATIEEALDFLDNYNHNAYADVQVLMADGTGNSVINEGDIRIFKEGSFQVVTNFLQSHPELGDLGINGFERYNIAVGMFENMTEPSVEYFRDICDAVHVEKSYSWTCHSMICDLSNQIMYLYYSGDYEKQVVIDLNEELKKGEHSIYLGSLFEPENNNPPAKPEPPTGNESGIPGEVIEYRIKKTSDPDGDKISYLFDWGDGNQSLWLYKTMGTIKSSYNWIERGKYDVRVKARDEYGAESEWSDPLVVTMPKTKSFNEFNPWILRLIQRFPIFEFLI
jgi:hypothetical protein